MTWFIDFLNGLPIDNPLLKTATHITISIALIILFGFLLTRLTNLLKLPNVTGYIIAGILIGPYCFNLIPQSVIEGTQFLTNIALAFIAFSVGEYFKLETLKKSGLKILILTLFEALMASLLVFIVMFFIFHLPVAFCIVLAALASATAPASTIMTIKQTKAKGDFVDTLLQVIALDDVVSLVAYSIAISIAVASIGSGSGSGFNIADVILPIVWNLLMIILGGVLGFALKFLLKKGSNDNRLIIVLCTLFLFCGIAGMLNVSPLLGCMVLGTVYINITNDSELFLQVNYFSPPILLIYFVRSGLSFQLDSLFSGGNFGTAPLIVVAVVYFFIRIIGKYLGAFAGCQVIKKTKTTRNYMGLALIPQAGVALGLAEMGGSIIGGEAGAALKTIIIASSVLYELVGPACAKLSLYLSKSYSTKLEDVVPDEEIENLEPTEEPKNEV